MKYIMFYIHQTKYLLKSPEVGIPESTMANSLSSVLSEIHFPSTWMVRVASSNSDTAVDIDSDTTSEHDTKNIKFQNKEIRVESL